MVSIDTNIGFFDENRNHFQLIILETPERWAYVQLIKNFKLIDKKFHVGQPRFFISDGGRFLHLVGYRYYHKIDLNDLSSILVERPDTLITPDFITQLELAKNRPEPILVELILNNMDRCLFEKTCEKQLSEIAMGQMREKRLRRQLEVVEAQLSRARLSSLFSKSSFAIETTPDGELVLTKGTFKDHRKEGKCKTWTKDFLVTAHYSKDVRISPDVMIYCPQKHITVEGKVKLDTQDLLEDLELSLLRFHKTKIEPETILSFKNLNFNGYGTIFFDDGNWVHGLIENNRFVMNKANKRKVIKYDGKEMIIKELTDSELVIEGMKVTLDYENGMILLSKVLS